MANIHYNKALPNHESFSPCQSHETVPLSGYVVDESEGSAHIWDRDHGESVDFRGYGANQMCGLFPPERDSPVRFLEYIFALVTNLGHIRADAGFQIFKWLL